MLPDKITLRKQYSFVSQNVEADQKICKNVLELPEIAQANSIFGFVGQNGEIQTTDLLDMLLNSGKKVYVPESLGKGIMALHEYTGSEALKAKDRYGIAIPENNGLKPDEVIIDVALVPGVCFSKDKKRLGRGGGYYDRFLKNFSGLALGLCRSECVLDTLPSEEWDKKVNLVITESKIIR